jgi:hypothetical protein
MQADLTLAGQLVWPIFGRLLQNPRLGHDEAKHGCHYRVNYGKQRDELPDG